MGLLLNVFKHYVVQVALSHYDADTEAISGFQAATCFLHSCTALINVSFNLVSIGEHYFFIFNVLNLNIISNKCKLILIEVIFHSTIEDCAPTISPYGKICCDSVFMRWKKP